MKMKFTNSKFNLEFSVFVFIVTSKKNGSVPLLILYVSIARTFVICIHQMTPLYQFSPGIGAQGLSVMKVN